MADYVGVPVISETEPNQAPSFQAICKLWVKSDFWPIDDAIRLILGKPPSVFLNKTAKSGADDKSLDIVLNIALNCVGGTLNVVQDAKLPGKLRVKPLEIISWAKEKGFAIPPELDSAVHSYNRVQSETDASSLIGIRSKYHRERVRAIATLLKDQDPKVELAKLISSPEVLEYGCEGVHYSESVLVSWLSDPDNQR